MRIAAARASREHPILLEMLADGRLHLTGIAKLAPHLTRENREALLRRAVHRSKRDIEELVAALAPLPDAPTVMRKLPARRTDTSRVLFGPVDPGKASPALELRPDGVASADSEVRLEAVPGVAPPDMPRTTVAPLAPARYKVQFTASAELHDKLQRLQALIRSSAPDADAWPLIDRWSRPARRGS